MVCQPSRVAFCDPRLELIINDARAELERREESYDVKPRLKGVIGLNMVVYGRYNDVCGQLNPVALPTIQAKVEAVLFGLKHVRSFASHPSRGGSSTF
ncbi:hypothetical protein AgCh_036848 [Apium graveolens]